MPTAVSVSGSSKDGSGGGAVVRVGISPFVSSQDADSAHISPLLARNNELMEEQNELMREMVKSQRDLIKELRSGNGHGTGKDKE